MENSTEPSSSRIKKKKKTKKEKEFSKYISQEEVESGLKTECLVKGIIRINFKNCRESYVGNKDVSNPDYKINSIVDRNRAFEGDEVVLKLKSVAKDNRKLMQVVHITQKVHPRLAVGFLKLVENTENSNKNALFTPRDKRIPLIYIPEATWPKDFESSTDLYKDKLFVVKVTQWSKPNYTLGKITKVLGPIGVLKVESAAILIELCLDVKSYGDNVKECLPKSTDIPKKEFICREDIRKECVFTIDNSSTDFKDDAISFKTLPNGNYEVGVHIADVSYYLKENTLLDELVMKKGTTKYMVHDIYEMLPNELCLQCSLSSGEDKLAFSMFWELTSDGQIREERFARTIINSCAQLSYEQAQIMIDEPKKNFSKDNLPLIHNGFTSTDLSQIISNLETISVCLRDKRKENGAINFCRTSVSFLLDPTTGEPLEIVTKQRIQTQDLVQEFMILANISAAKTIYNTFPNLAFLRMHEPPKAAAMLQLQNSLQTIGFNLDISSTAAIQSSINQYITDDLMGEARMRVFSRLLARPMGKESYICAGVLEKNTSFSHYGLGVPLYTHFTSPIRRYADIITHRLLAASLNYCDKPKWTPEEVASVAKNCTKQELQAKKAERASSDLYLSYYIEQHKPYIQNAVVVEVREKSFDIIVLNTGSIVRLYTNMFEEDVTFIPEEVKVRETTDDDIPMWKIHVKFPKTDLDLEVSIVLETFSLITVELCKKPNTTELEAKLLRSIPKLN